MLASDGHQDVLLADASSLDYSGLTVTYTMPGATAGDLSKDAAIDRDDVAILLLSLNTLAAGPTDPRDLDHDGRITALWAWQLDLYYGPDLLMVIPGATCAHPASRRTSHAVHRRTGTGRTGLESTPSGAALKGCS